MSNERYDEKNHLDLTHAPSLATYIGKTLASYVSGNRMPEISGDNRKRIPDHIRARYDRDCERLAEEVLRYITKAAPALPLPEGGGPHQRWGILNHLGGFWTPENFDTERQAAAYLDRWKRDNPKMDLSRHKVIPVLVTITAAPTGDARNGKGEG